MRALASLDSSARQYLLVTLNYWVFTLTDGALRMLVLLYFHQLGYSPLQIAMLFLFYEFFGIVTNLVGGWLGARIGLNRTMNLGLLLQVLALAALLVPENLLTVTWVMAAQALSGIAKDLNKMSAKSSVRLLAGTEQQSQLYRWVAVLTGSKNTLKGAGYFLGAALLNLLSFRGAVLVMIIALVATLLFSLMALQRDLGKAKSKPRFREIFSKSAAVNWLSFARFFLFSARDVWFVVALPVYLSQTLGWQHWQVGAFFAFWIIGYGIIQALAPRITGTKSDHPPDGKGVFSWGLLLSVIPGLMALVLWAGYGSAWILITGLALFGVVFAVNSAVHSFLIVSFAESDGVSLDVGFYYMANAAGRLVGTVLSGWVFQQWGLAACLLLSAIFVFISAITARRLPLNEVVM